MLKEQGLMNLNHVQLSDLTSLFENISTQIIVRPCKDLEDKYIAHCLCFNIVAYGNDIESAISELIELCFDKWEYERKNSEVTKHASEKYFKELKNLKVFFVKKYNRNKLTIECTVYVNSFFKLSDQNDNHTV